ncbi:MAG: phasin family protein [Alphaproteobacteria bacterium]|nr:phasin family protein [Alphaproteobacteria bacterium]
MFDPSSYDVSKMFDMSNYNKFFDISKFSGDYKIPQIPGIDSEAVLSLQKKNIEAMTAISQATYESLQALWRRQADSYRQIVEELSQMTQAVIACPTPEAKALKQAEVSKSTMDKYISNLRDASETVAKCNSQAMEAVGTRLNESLNELCGLVKNASSRAA